MALAVSIAVHEVVAGLLPRQPFQSNPRREIVTSVQPIAIAVRRTPTPAPRVPEVPMRPAPDRFAPARDAMGAAGRPGSARATRAVTAPRAAFARHWDARPEWDVAGSGVRAAAGTDAGSGGNGDAGVGPGAGVAGSGAGKTTSGQPPCGIVTFSDPHGSAYDPRTRGFWVDVRMSVHFADGTSQSQILDYPWYYPSEAANPWSDQNVKDPNFPTRFQPPPAAKLGGEPPLVRYVMSHSTPEGLTMLDECPQPSSAPAP